MKEKTADEMFEDLEYEKDIDVSYGLIRYNKEDKQYIRFIIEEKCVEANTILTNELNDSISKQKIKDIIYRIDYDIEKTKEIISKNTSVYATYRKNDYQIVRLRAMNTKSLDIKKRLQKLLESEE